MSVKYLEVYELDEIINNIVEAFNLKAKTISKSKYMYICKTDKGVKVLKPVNISAEKIEFCHKVKESLYKSGFVNLDRFQLSVLEKPYHIYGNTPYVLTDYINYPETDLTNMYQIKEIITTLAKLHNISKNNKYYEEIPESETTDICSEFKKSLERLKVLKKFASNQKQLSDFDVMFIKNYSYYCNEASDSLNILEKSEFSNLQNEAYNKKMICHNSINEENFLISSNGLYITNFNLCSIDCSLIDLAEFITRYIRKHGEDYLSINEIIDLYNVINPINDNELKILYAIIKFPLKYINVCNSYYSRRRSLTPNSITNRLKTIIEKKEHQSEYIKPLINV